MIRAAHHRDADSDERQRPQAAQHVAGLEPAEIVGEQDRADEDDDDADDQSGRDQRVMIVVGSRVRRGRSRPFGARGLVIEVHAAHPPEAPGVGPRCSRPESRTRKLKPEAMTKIGQAVPQPRPNSSNTPTRQYRPVASSQMPPERSRWRLGSHQAPQAERDQRDRKIAPPADRHLVAEIDRQHHAAEREQEQPQHQARAARVSVRLQIFHQNTPARRAVLKSMRRPYGGRYSCTSAHR